MKAKHIAKQSVIESNEPPISPNERREPELEPRKDCTCPEESSFQLVANMSARVAHEIRNPLAGISGAMEVLRDSVPESDQTASVVENVEQQVRRIEGTVRELLSFARPREAVLEATNLHEIIDVALRRLSGHGEKGITVTRHFAEDLPVVCVDRELFTGALVNLFANSLDALPDKGALVVTTSSSASAVQVSVRDNGTGIAPASRGRIFEPFYSTKTRGTGLGLAICCQIAKAHGGSISVSSFTGGTDFVVTLPKASRGGVSNPSKPIGVVSLPRRKETIQKFLSKNLKARGRLRMENSNG